MRALEPITDQNITHVQTITPTAVKLKLRYSRMVYDHTKPTC